MPVRLPAAIGREQRGAPAKLFRVMKPEDEDVVVGELDVYLRSPAENTELHLLQYPLRHARSKMGSERRIAHVQLRPRHARLQLKLQLYPQLDDFTQTKSFNADAAVEKQIGQQQTLVSQPHLQPPQSNYVVGCYVPNAPSGAAFNLVPLRAVHQLRPTFGHIDEHDRNQLLARAERKGLLSGAAVDAPLDAAPLQLSFRRRESERAAERRRNSYATLTQREQTDDWLPLQFAPAHRDDVQAKKNALFACAELLDVKDTAFELTTSYRDLYQLHTRHLRAGFVAKASVDKDKLSAKQLRALPTDSAVACAVKQARIVRLSELHELVGTHRGGEELLSSLRKCAQHGGDNEQCSAKLGRTAADLVRGGAERAARGGGKTERGWVETEAGCGRQVCAAA
ncbi:unnamed protein product [Agarophyton chilense]